MSSLAISFTEIQMQAEIFLDSLFSQINEKGIAIEPHWDIDHLCFRVDSLDAYNNYKLAFSLFGNLLTEANVNGRPIATYELSNPIRYKDWLIKLVELPAPKSGKLCNTGFEHIEVVVDVALNELAMKYPKLSWDISGLEKIYNAELELPLDQCAIKFHNQSLRTVINFELRPKMAILVSELKLLEIFRNQQPFIAGTIPLGIDNPDSDIDFLVSFAHIEDFALICRQAFLKQDEFELGSGKTEDSEYALCRFNYKGVPVEIFSSSISTFKQNAYVHFEVEEKILKYAPHEWRSEIMKLKRSGVKTEPAFAMMMKNMTGDAYQYLHTLQKKSIADLRVAIHLATRGH